MRFILLGTVNNRLMPLVTWDTLPSNASVKHNVLLLSSTESNFLLEIPQNETSFFPASNTHVSIVCYRSFLASYLKYVRVISWYFGHSSFQLWLRMGSAADMVLQSGAGWSWLDVPARCLSVGWNRFWLGQQPAAVCGRSQNSKRLQ